MRDLGDGLTGFGGNSYLSSSFAASVGARDSGGLSFERRPPDENGRLDGLARAGTRKAATEQEAAVPRLDGRNACVRALRKHTCAVLIEGWRCWEGVNVSRMMAGDIFG